MSADKIDVDSLEEALPLDKIEFPGDYIDEIELSPRNKRKIKESVRKLTNHFGSMPDNEILERALDVESKNHSIRKMRLNFMNWSFNQMFAKDKNGKYRHKITSNELQERGDFKKRQTQIKSMIIRTDPDYYEK